MNIDQATKILNGTYDNEYNWWEFPDLKSEAYIKWTPEERNLEVNGEPSPDELEALAVFMRSKK